MTDPASERRRIVMDAFDAVLDLSPAERAATLRARHGEDPDLIATIEALAAADSAATIMPANSPGDIDFVVPERVGVYRLCERLGRGGMGEVWRAERDDELFEHAVAIKLMRPSLIGPALNNFFDSERRLLARLRHPYIARLFDGGVAEGVPWFAMDLVDGVPLDEWLAGRTPLASVRDEPAVRVRLAVAIGEAVQHAHQSLIVHADLKPANVLVDREGQPRLVDFGIARLISAADTPDRARAYPRTTAFASPERLAGGAPSVADDIYALGTMTNGLLRDVPTDRDLGAIVARARAADPLARYPTVAALIDDLRRWLEHRPVAARDGGWRYAAARYARRNRWPVAAATLALAGLIATTIIVSALYVRAETARHDAERRFADVRRLARYMLVDFHDALEPLAGASALRARTAQVGRVYLERLSRAPDASPDLIKELGVGYGRVGHTLAVTATNGTRGIAAGDEALARAAALLTPLVAAHPDRADLKVELARVLTWRSSSVAAAHSDMPRAHRLLDRAFALDDAAAARRPGDVDAAYARWLAVLGRLDLMITQERYREIAAIAADQERRARAIPVPPRYAMLRPLMDAAIANFAGDAAYGLDRPREALAHYATAYATLDRVRWPDVRVRTRRIAYAYQLSSSYQELGDRAAALRWADQAVRDAAILLQFERSPVVMSVTSLATIQHATLLVESGRADTGIAEARAMIDRRRRDALAEPNSDEAWAGYLFSIRPYVEILDQAKRPQAACAAARIADAGWTRVYRGRTMPERQARDAARIAARVAKCSA